jgi:hypothetical protein
MILNPIKSVQTRLLSLMGIIVCAFGIALGLWPSIYTIVALLMLPSPFIFIWVVFQPSILARWPKLRFYLIASVALSVLAWTSEYAWLYFGVNDWIPPWR